MTDESKHSPLNAAALISKGRNVVDASIGFSHENSHVLSILRATSADEIACSADSSELTLSDSSFEVLKTIEANCQVLVRGFGEGGSDAVFSRLGMFQSILDAKNTAASIASLKVRGDTVRCIRGSDSLDVAATAMLSSGCEAVAIVDQGIITGVVTCTSLVSHIRKQLEAHRNANGEARRNAATGASDDEDDDDDDAEDIKALTGGGSGAAATAEQPQQLSERRKVAQQFVDSWCCELLIAMYASPPGGPARSV
jgi:hypothetical protein